MESLLERICGVTNDLNLNIDISKAAILSGAFRIYPSISLNRLSHFLELPLNETEQIIDSLIQKNILVRKKSSSISLRESLLGLESALSIDTLSTDELIVLGWMKGFGGINLKDIEFFTGLSNDRCTRYLLSLVGQGYLEGNFENKNQFVVTSVAKITPISLTKIPILSQALIGMLICWKQRLKINKMAEILQIEDSVVFLRLIFLLAADIITADLSIFSRSPRGRTLACHLKKINYERNNNNIAHFSGFYAQILGMLLIHRPLSIPELAYNFQISKNNLLKGLFVIVAQNILPLQITLKKDLNGSVSLKLSDYPPQITRGDLDLIEFFLITQLELKKTQSIKIPISDLGMDSRLVLDILGNLALKGVIRGHLKKENFLLSNSLTFLMESKSVFQKARIIGYLQSTPNPTIPGLCEKLKISPEIAFTLIDALNSADDTTIEQKNSKLLFQGLAFQSLPILGLPQDMLIILGYLNCVRVIDPPTASLLLQLPVKRIIVNIFALIGAGYVKVLFKNNEIRVTQRHKLVPQLEALSERYVELLTLLVSDKINLSDLSKSLGQSNVLIRWQICALVALGFLECQLHENHLIIKSRPISQGGAPYRVRCYSCSYPLTSDSNWCPKCGFSKQSCVVCRGIIEFGSKLGSCPFCDITGHLEHLQEYLKTYHACPICRQQYTSDQLHVLKATSSGPST